MNEERKNVEVQKTINFFPHKMKVIIFTFPTMPT